ncbi:MAG: RusA family crossover junction endodeoxyribonuclease [Candidatus Pacebacteria bacterium]|nr:RusA family crossover junction endodeoxyribonuclease [Candidatus Paceibacterota bacterium]
MAKKLFDFNVGLLTLAPCHDWGYKESDKGVEAKVNENKENFKKILAEAVKKEIEKNNLENFPTEKPVGIFVLQCFSAEKEYCRRDLDNMAKVILDGLKNVVYKNDGQVKTLLLTKKLNDNRIPDNFLYITVKEQKIDTDIAYVHEAGIEQAFILYRKLKATYETLTS